MAITPAPLARLPGVRASPVTAAATGAAADTRIRVMVVDDSVTIRGIVVRMLTADPELQVVATAANGEIAIREITRVPADVIILDIEMPGMDGLTALPHLLRARPGVAILIASTLSQRNAEISLRALSLGATDYLPKPETKGLNNATTFQRELLQKVKILGRRVRLREARPTPAAAVAAAPRATSAPPPMLARPHRAGRPEIIAIGSSTGGPQALFAFLKELPRALNVPIVITQHMPPTFTTILAQHLTRTSGWPSAEARDGEPILPGTITVAPGDHHLQVERKDRNFVARLTQAPPEHFCRPSVNPMFRSLAQICGPNVLAVMLTGMGSDGLEGSRALVAAGGALVAQDEASSVVWGMPGAVANAGLCSAVLPLPSIAGFVRNAFEGAGK